MTELAPTLDDPHLWLEDVLGDAALDWVRERNAETLAALTARPEYEPTRSGLLQILNSKDRIPYVSRRGDHLYNLWKDESHPRGLWRRTSLAEYRKPAPAWETVLDLDALARQEGENWVWAGAIGLAPAHARCLVKLSRGGADACVMREFDTTSKAFVVDGFTLPEAKSIADWADADTLYVGTDWGPGSNTASGYPRVIKQWRRGSPLHEAVTVFEGVASDVSVGVSVDPTPGHERTHFVRNLDFYNSVHWELKNSALHALQVPLDASIVFWNSAGAPADTLLMELRSDLQTPTQIHVRGSLVACDAAAYLRGEREFQVLFEPTATRSLSGFALTRSHVIVNVLDNVACKLEEWSRGEAGWVHREVAAPFPGTLGVSSLHDPMLRGDPWAENYLLTYTDFLTPDTLWLCQSGADAREALKSLPPAFDAEGLRAEQRFATSADGTRVPYFVVWPRGAGPAGADTAPAPTLLYGYGGFEVSMLPRYSALYGSAWLARGGVWVVANIRGGGEFGPGWHQAAVKENKQRSYDDFLAVAQDLVARGVTDPQHLGIEGGSNGGLLVGAAITQRPDLFKAAVCSVPLLDMRRYHRLLAGASWMAEYGDPDQPEDWAYIALYSPYQQLRPGVNYPKVLFTTSTRDDRVHPGHARKMAARMRSLGAEVLYFENIEGGHGGAADNAQRAHVQALEMAHLWRQLGGGS